MFLSSMKSEVVPSPSSTKLYQDSEKHIPNSALKNVEQPDFFKIPFVR